jgi:iron complex transport system substrate-binding protein
MKWIAAALMLLIAGQAAAATPQRIMSLKVCTDELLLDLVPASRIASITFLSREKPSLRLWPQASALAVNHGTAEEILAVHPDLILTDSFLAPGLRLLLAKSGAKVVEVAPAENFDQIRAVTRQVAKAVGEVARGQLLIAQMDEELATLKAHQPKRVLSVAGWGGGGYVPGSGGLFDAILKAAGARNVERSSFGYYDVESLIAAHPDVLVYSDIYSGTASLRDDQDLHPALLKGYSGRRISYAALYGCGVPQSVMVAKQIQDELGKVRP